MDALLGAMVGYFIDPLIVGIIIYIITKKNKPTIKLAICRFLVLAGICFTWDFGFGFFSERSIFGRYTIFFIAHLLDIIIIAALIEYVTGVQYSERLKSKNNN